MSAVAAPPTLASSARSKVLCVDDEAQVIEGLSLNLRRRYDVLKATSGAAGLEILRQDATIQVVISDMRMPMMDGAAFLSRARQILPDAVRILLTGQAQFEAAVAAVNEGQIFRFLTKPCPPAALIATVDAAAEQHRLITAERILLEQTLHGSIKTLSDVLALTSPTLFGRANRTKQYVTEIADQLGLRQRWQLEVAAMLSQLGAITLPADTVARVHRGVPLTQEDQQMVARMPAITEQLVGHIPRLEVVRGILSTYASVHPPSVTVPVGPDRELIVLGAQILRAALDYEILDSQGVPAAAALATLRSRRDRHDGAVLDALQAARGLKAQGETIRELTLLEIRVGMILNEDVTLTTGMLLAARGYEVTAGFVERARNYQGAVVKGKIRVIIPPGCVEQP